MEIAARRVKTPAALSALTGKIEKDQASIPQYPLDRKNKPKKIHFWSIFSKPNTGEMIPTALGLFDSKYAQHKTKYNPRSKIGKDFIISHGKFHNSEIINLSETLKLFFPKQKLLFPPPLIRLIGGGFFFWGRTGQWKIHTQGGSVKYVFEVDVTRLEVSEDVCRQLLLAQTAKNHTRLTGISEAAVSKRKSEVHKKFKNFFWKKVNFSRFFWVVK